jgi:hypothetical protein
MSRNRALQPLQVPFLTLKTSQVLNGTHSVSKAIFGIGSHSFPASTLEFLFAAREGGDAHFMSAP